MTRLTKRQLSQDMEEILIKAKEEGYSIGAKDIFAIGYMAGKYNITKLKDNQEEVIKACQEYDKTDDLALLDTIGETLIDLNIISNEKGEL